MQNEWGEFIETINEKQQASGQGLSQIIISLIDTAEPQADLPPKSDIPLYMPMKVCLTGNTLSGKTTLAHKLSSKYGTMIINPQSVIK